MPIVTIDVRQQYLAALEVKIMQAVHTAFHQRVDGTSRYSIKYFKILISLN